MSSSCSNNPTPFRFNDLPEELQVSVLQCGISAWSLVLRKPRPAETCHSGSPAYKQYRCHSFYGNKVREVGETCNSSVRLVSRSLRRIYDVAMRRQFDGFLELRARPSKRTQAPLSAVSLEGYETCTHEECRHDTSNLLDGILSAVKVLRISTGVPRLEDFVLASMLPKCKILTIRLDIVPDTVTAQMADLDEEARKLKLKALACKGLCWDSNAGGKDFMKGEMFFTSHDLGKLRRGGMRTLFELRCHARNPDQETRYEFSAAVIDFNEDGIQKIYMWIIVPWSNQFEAPRNICSTLERLAMGSATSTTSKKECEIPMP